MMGINAKLCVTFSLMMFSLLANGDEHRVVDAAKNGDLVTVRSLIKSGANINLPEEDGTTALAYAAHQNDLDMILDLLDANAEVNSTNDYGVTPLYLASANADAALIEKLLQAGANPNTGLLSGETPLMVAAERGKLDVARLLLNYDADPNAQEINAGQTALMWAVAAKHGTIADLLVEYEADVRMRSNSGFSPLLFAAQQGDVDTVGALLAAGAAVDESVPNSGLTPLMIASIGGYSDVAELLLKKGANPNAVDSKGFTPLHEVAKDRTAIVLIKTLLAYGADPNTRIKNPKTTAGNAGGGYGRGSTAPSGISLEGATPLLVAAGLNRVETVKVLLEAGADPLIATEQNVTPLMMASGAGTGFNSSDAETGLELETVSLLVNRDANVNAVGQFGWTPLHLAAYHGYNNVIDFLINSGANPNTMDGFGQTPLSISYAIVTEGMGDAYTQTPRSFRRETADLLLSLGAVPLEKSGVKIVSQRAAE